MKIVHSVHILCAAAISLLSAIAVAATPVATAQTIAQARVQAASDHLYASRPVDCNGRHPQGIRYHAQLLETLDRANSYPRAINNSGAIVGVREGRNLTRATLWIGRRGLDLPPVDQNISSAHGINDAGSIVGVTHDANGNLRGTRWFLGTPRYLPNLADTDLYSTAYAVNRLGKSVGFSSMPDGGEWRAAVWSGAAPRILASLGGRSSTAYSINDRGFAAGVSTLAGPVTIQHAALWRPDGSVQDLGTLGGSSSRAASINNKGKVAGTSLMAGDVRSAAVVWHLGVATELQGLGGLTSSASGINNHDQVVGFSTTDDGQGYGTIWFNGTPVQINTLLDDESQGFNISYGIAINDRGQIVAMLATQIPPDEAVLLTPRPCRYR